MPPFIKGKELNRKFYHEVVAPLMQKHFPDLKYSAALNGHGSDVLGYDDPTSMDHNWGPHLNLFFYKSEFRKYSKLVNQMLRENLPYTFMGFSTNFTKEDPNAYLRQVQEYITEGEVNHLFGFFTIQSFLKHYLYFDRDEEIEIEDWLTFPAQALIEVTSGEVFHDGLKELEPMRALFKYYPDDIWLYILRTSWFRITDEKAFPARSGIAGDEIGSRVIMGKLALEIMRMAFLLERRYFPYDKWLGTAFSELPLAEKLKPGLKGILESPTWQERQKHLTDVMEILAEEHITRGITKRAKIIRKDFHGRGFEVLDPSELMDEIDNRIIAKHILDRKYQIGSVDQFMNHSKINHTNYFYRALRRILK